jgi:hypothetical protein
MAETPAAWITGAGIRYFSAIWSWMRHEAYDNVIAW